MAEDEAVRAKMFKIASPEVLRLATMHMMIPEYHDEQRLMGDGGGKLGPLAGIFLSPFFAGMSEFKIRAHGSLGVLAGFVIVMQHPGEALPNSYRRLNLNWGMNCVWLELVAASKYVAHVTPPGPGDVCRPTTTPGPALSVIATPTGLPPRDNSPGARFTDDAGGNPLLGLPCAQAWCEIGPAGGFSPRPSMIPTLALKLGARREVLVKGWHDEQYLDEFRGGAWIATSARATIVPRPSINEIPPGQYLTWRRVADIYLDRDPDPTSRFAGILRQGWNVAELMNPGGGPKWMYRLTSGSGAGATTSITEVLGPDLHQDAVVPGSARWRYTMRDPGIWAPCGGNACCQSDGGDI